ncbi:hypothetical protein KL930_004405 [Ogataea haglerorum]|uniref:Cysteine protease RIM13 n=1 Tax=Ogataea haglerorum TaxID=1937702 RepID=A0AAN6D2I0_9ASCO|nr:uncharacterized protein KL911_004759 [Ogataea haglerorum]KAG7692611.1 hypothetical protein KL915_004658 [Ogataea haglerorum]KAG7692847.1 hypothetical protein KL951_004858 [Ogataea haglerorum]KAG7703558.1 hypothetical protein KL950_004786 [Ogataea haglerorum]KAG7725339.1 hypothetical protein KL933_004353 [Ogataea haglerorum]KAG7727410.1 hypothetical protein KL948_004559 [Ogataea haglerorum]
MDQVYSKIEAIQTNLNELLYRYALSQPVKTECLSLIKQFQLVIDSGFVPEQVKGLGNKLLGFYDHLKSGRPFLTPDEKMCWIFSKQDSFYYPFDEQIGVFVAPGSTNSLDLSTDGIEDLYQESLANCSFVSSLITMASHGFDLLSLVHTDTKTSRFALTLEFNGCRRVVWTDSSLPADQSRYVKSSTNPELLWPAIVEKAYLQIHNASHLSDFRGSNIGIDTYILTGYVPEYVEIDDLTRDQMEDIARKHSTADLVLGLGTSNLSAEECRRFNLAPNHDYSVLSIKKDKLAQYGFRFQLRNPWNLAKRDMEVSDLYPFNVLYLNWKLNNFSKITKHVIYKDTLGAIEYPQFSLQNHDYPNMVYVLIERHLNQPETYLRAEWYETQGEKLWTLTGAKRILKSPTNRSRFVLSKLRLNPGQVATGVLIANSTSSIRYSVHFFSGHKLTVGRPSFKYKHIEEVSDQWTPMTAGGSWLHSTYIDNPQFEIAGALGKTEIGLYSNSVANVLLFETSESFLTKFDERTLVAGQRLEYDQSGFIFKTNLSPKSRYIAVVSTKDPSTLGRFKLIVNSESPLTMTRLSTSLGLFTQAKTFRDSESYKYQFVVLKPSRVAIRIRSPIAYDFSVSATYFRKDYKKISEKYGYFVHFDTLQPEIYTISIRLSQKGPCTVDLGSSHRLG